jgi:hypothetical protein
MVLNNSDNYAITQYDVLIGGASNQITSITPSTSGLALASNGTATNPSFQIIPVGFAYIEQVFTGSGTYTPTTGMIYADIEVWGAGGGGAGVAASSSSVISAGGGGGAGGYARKLVSAATIGSSQTVTIGAAGAAGAATNSGTGGTGGTTSVGSIVSATGGVGGTTTAGAVAIANSGGAGGAGASGDFNTTGDPGGSGWGYCYGPPAQIAIAGSGAHGFYGGAPITMGSAVTSASSTGQTGTSYAAGGSGAYSTPSGSAQVGGAGSAGLIIITEYLKS